MVRVLTIIAACAILSACTGGEVRESLGVNRKAPDEFKVVSRPPLSVPPDFYLRPPEPGAPDLAVQSTEKKAESLVIREGAPDPFVDNVLKEKAVETAIDPTIVTDLEEITPQSKAAEEAFLSSVGAAEADKDIREMIYEDNLEEQTTQDTEYPLQDWLGITTDDEDVVDPKAEAERIRANKDAGKPVNEGEVPTDSTDEPVSILDSIF